MRSTACLLAVLAMTCACADQAVSFAQIKGARMAKGDTWRLALSGPECGDVITRRCDIALQPNRKTPLIDVPEQLSGRRFTVLLNLAQVAGGLIRLSAQGVKEDVRTVMVSRDGWQAVRFGPVDGSGEMKLAIEATAPATVRSVTVYRSFSQLFGNGGEPALVGAAYHKLGQDDLLSEPLLPGSYRHHRTGQWNPPPVTRENGIHAASLDKPYQAFLNGPLETELGIPVPVRAPDGIAFCARLKGHFAFIVYPENAKYLMTWAGEEDAWSAAALRFDGSVLDDDGNGVYTGKKKVDWAGARTWCDNFGTGTLDFIVVLPQNEVPLPDAGVTSLRFDYEAMEGTKSVGYDLPVGAVAVALVNAGPRDIKVLSRTGTQYTRIGVITDSRAENCLGVVAGSMRLQ